MHVYAIYRKDAMRYGRLLLSMILNS